MNENELIIALLSVMEKDDVTKRYFSSNIDWLEDRKQRWKDHYIRVGVIGVTSSGKSTLLNALMGESLLPTAVRPSSGILVTCKKGTVNEANVYFQNGNVERLAGAELAQMLETFADEKHNGNNNKAVRMVELQAAQFQLDSVIELIDSPGLDAYGLEHHEMLTMETLLPMIDICLFVVTLKANSDESTYRIVKAVRDHDKPLIIVQNMLDSVEPKQGRHGIIHKTREEVAMEHKNRLQNIIAQVEEGLENKISIVQVSAKQALMAKQFPTDKEKYKSSQFDQLIHSFQEEVNRLRPDILKQRMLQLKRHIAEIIYDDDERQIGLQQATLNLKKQYERFAIYERQEEKLSLNYMETCELLASTIQQVREKFNRTIMDIGKLGQKQVHEANQQLQLLKEHIDHVEQQLIQISRSNDKQITKLNQQLNINENDYKNELLLSNLRISTPSIVNKKIVQETYQAEKKGAVNKVFRWFGSKFGKNQWGYEQQERDIEVIDHMMLRRQLLMTRNQVTQSFSSFRDQWMRQMTVKLKKVEQEIKRRKKILDSDALSVEETQHIQSVMYNLRTLLERENQLQKVKVSKREKAIQQSEQKPIIQDHSIHESDDQKSATEKRTVIPIDSATFTLYTLSQQMIINSFSLAFDFTQRHTTANDVAFRISVIWGWDETSLIHFCTRFLQRSIHADQLELFATNHGLLNIVHDHHHYIVVNETRLTSHDEKRLFSLLNEQPYMIYMLVNTIQQGAAIKQLKESLVYTNPLTEQSVIHWVSQSFTEFIEGNNIEEGLQSLIEISKEGPSGIQGLYLLNDRNPIYSLLLAELSLHKQRTIDVESQIQATLQRTFAHLVREKSVWKHCADLIRAYPK
ncbi:dynamin family protein [Paenibacillus wenxiniae]|uniref:Dynamin family protein n=1 Tax=Paenibacillus wenxiniae TaxID=1636843 RepID=A0ABW4RFV8_9BACL